MELLIWRKVKVVVGIEGARTALIQAEKEYEAISRLYPDGKIILRTGIPADPRAVYYAWVNDRGFNGLWNIHIQFLGMDPQTLLDIIRNYPYDYWGNPQKWEYRKFKWCRSIYNKKLEILGFG